MDMFEHKYTICTEADEDIYRKQCAALEKSIPGIKKMEEKRDVDDSIIQLYILDGRSIVVVNDIDAGLVRMNSEIPLEPYFENRKQKRRPQRTPVPVTAKNVPKTQLA